MPGFVVNAVTKKALTDATSWVKVESEKSEKVQASGGGGGGGGGGGAPRAEAEAELQQAAPRKAGREAGPEWRDCGE